MKTFIVFLICIIISLQLCASQQRKRLVSFTASDFNQSDFLTKSIRSVASSFRLEDSSRQSSSRKSSFFLDNDDAPKQQQLLQSKFLQSAAVKNASSVCQSSIIKRKSSVFFFDDDNTHQQSLPEVKPVNLTIKKQISKPVLNTTTSSDAQICDQQPLPKIPTRLIKEQARTNLQPVKPVCISYDFNFQQRPQGASGSRFAQSPQSRLCPTERHIRLYKDNPYELFEITPSARPCKIQAAHAKIILELVTRIKDRPKREELSRLVHQSYDKLMQTIQNRQNLEILKVQNKKQ